MKFESLPKRWLRFIKFPPQIAYALGLGWLMGRMVLLLTTTGRKSGRLRVTPLQYEELNGKIYISSARGTEADWYRNIVENPHVKVRVKNRYFEGLAEATTNVDCMTDFLELRLKRHPRLIKPILRAEGLPPEPSKEQLKLYSARLALVIIRPEV